MRLRSRIYTFSIFFIFTSVLISHQTHAYISEFEYRNLAHIELGVHGVLLICYRMDQHNTDFPLFAGEVIGKGAVQILSYKIHNFASGNNLEVELTIRLPKNIYQYQEPITFRYREILVNSYQHTPNKFEKTMPNHHELWKVKFHAFQTSGPRILGFAVQTSQTSGIARLHWVGNDSFHYNISGVPAHRYSDFETALESMTLEMDLRAANGGRRDFSELVADVEEGLQTGRIGTKSDLPLDESVSFDEFVDPQGPLLKMEIFPKQNMSQESREKGNFWWHINVHLNTDLNLKTRDTIIDKIHSILEGKSEAMPIKGVWLRNPGKLRRPHRLQYETIEFYGVNQKFPLWIFTYNRESSKKYGYTDVDPEIHSSPLPLPYYEFIQTKEVDAADSWKNQIEFIDPTKTGRRTITASLKQSLIEKLGPNVTFQDLLDEHCGSQANFVE